MPNPYQQPQRPINYVPQESPGKKVLKGALLVGLVIGASYTGRKLADHPAPANKPHTAGPANPKPARHTHRKATTTEISTPAQDALSEQQTAETYNTQAPAPIERAAANSPLTVVQPQPEPMAVIDNTPVYGMIVNGPDGYYGVCSTDYYNYDACNALIRDQFEFNWGWADRCRRIGIEEARGYGFREEDYAHSFRGRDPHTGGSLPPRDPVHQPVRNPEPRPGPHPVGPTPIGNPPIRGPFQLPGGGHPPTFQRPPQSVPHPSQSHSAPAQSHPQAPAHASNGGGGGRRH